MEEEGYDTVDNDRLLRLQRAGLENKRLTAVKKESCPIPPPPPPPPTMEEPIRATPPPSNNLVNFDDENGKKRKV